MVAQMTYLYRCLSDLILGQMKGYKHYIGDSFSTLLVIC